jgi:transposase
MYLKITKTKHREIEKQYAKIVESIRDKNVTRQKIILNLGPINSQEDLDKYKTILKEMKKEKEFIRFDKLEINSAKEYGVTYLVNKLFEKYQINKILKKYLTNNKAEFEVYETIKALIINRLLFPRSELSALDWIKNDYSEELNIKQEEIYKSLDYLIQHKKEIEIEIYNILKEDLKLNTKRTHYDLTSTYFEGHKCSIAMYGYSRDHRPDRKQVVVGLVMVDDIPTYHKVYEGNTVDVKTLPEVSKTLKEDFKLEEPILIADRGLISNDNIKDLEEKKLKYILGSKIRRNTISDELLKEEIELEKDETQGATIVKDENGKRHILCYDKNTRNERLKNLGNIKIKIPEKLSELQNKKIKKENLIIQVNKILGKNKRLFNVDFETWLGSQVPNETKWNDCKKPFEFSLKEDIYEFEKKIAGKFLIETNTNLSPDEVMKEYKNLQTVETGFDSLKNNLDIRPIFHRKEHRVKAHVFICVLALLIERIIEKFTEDTARVVIRKLRRISKIELEIEGEKRGKITKITKEIKKDFENFKFENFDILKM